MLKLLLLFQSCFSCHVCGTALDSVRAAVGISGDACCQSCYRAQWTAERARANVAKPAAVVHAAPGDPHACPRCAGKVIDFLQATLLDNKH